MKKGARKRCDNCGLLVKNCNCGSCVYTGGCDSRHGWGTYVGTYRYNPWK